MKKIDAEILKITAQLESEGKIHLASAIKENYNKTLLEYSAKIHNYKTKIKMEDVMKSAFSIEFHRLGYSKQEISKIISYLSHHRVLQTSPHISPGEKPRYFFINYLSSLYLTKDDYYPIAMFSGVPFSNKTRPGRICTKDEEINLIPSSMQDEMVYRNKTPEKAKIELAKLDPELKTIIKNSEIDDDYTKLALNLSQKIEGCLLGGKPLFFDFNEVATNYLLLALSDDNNPVTKIFINSEARKEVETEFKDMVFFYGQTQKGKYKEMENFYLKGKYFISPSRKILITKENIKKELNNGLCPGLVLGFLIFSFMNHFLCLGSFAQVEYLPLYKEKFMKMKFLKKYNIAIAPAGALTTGGFPDDLTLHPTDIIKNKDKKKILVKSRKILFGEALIAIKDVLLKQNYSMNLVRK